jgi:translocation and assembly module TamA
MRQPSAPWRALVLVILVVLAVGLTGCASLTKWLPESVPGSTKAASTPASAAYRVQINAPPELRTLLTTYLDISRFQSAPETDSITASELDRLIAAAPAQAKALLETEGYFSAEVKVEKVANVPSLPLLTVQVVPGPRATVSDVKFSFDGPLQQAAAASDADAASLTDKARGLWALPVGQAFRQSAWTSAKSASIALLRAEGYPAATWRSTNARVNAETQKAELELIADSGPLFRLGELRIEGLQRFDAQSVQRLSTFVAGEPYSEKRLLDFQERLQKSGLFEGSSVELDANPDSAAAAPVMVRVRELNLQQATIGAGFSANTGPRATLEHIHRRVFGTRWIAKNKFALGPDIQSWSGEFTSHPLEGRYRNLLSGSAERLRSTEELRTSWSARAGRTQDTPRIERLYFAEFQTSKLDNPLGSTQSSALSANYHWVWRDVDNVLLPTRGLTANLQAAVGRSFSNQTPEGLFGRAYARVTWYQPLGNNWYATLRGEAGHVQAGDGVVLPDTLLFRAGGDESVRGYAFRSLGPKVNNVLFSGKMLLTGSAEIARPISPNYPAFWWAAFVDAGDAANRWSDINVAAGYGLGLRWRSPVGPLRLDVAYGERVRAARLHLSVGIAF